MKLGALNPRNINMAAARKIASLPIVQKAAAQEKISPLQFVVRSLTTGAAPLPASFGMGSLFSSIRDAAESAVASYYPSLAPLASTGAGGTATAAPASAPAPAGSARTFTTTPAAHWYSSTWAMVGGVAALGVTAAMWLRKKKHRRGRR